MAAKVGATEARRRFGELLDRVQREGERFLITKGGREVAALVSAEDAKRLDSLEELLDLLLLRLLKAQGEEPVPVGSLLKQYERLFERPFPTVKR